MAAIKCVEQDVGGSWAIYQGDCCEVIQGIPDASVGFSVFSPPFAELYCYSDNERDIGNSKNYDQFFIHFAFLAKELRRVMQAGRVVAVHCIDIPAMKERDGYIGLKDFPGDIIRMFQKAGFIYHSRHVIWKDPLIEATRTKALGLMHKQLMKDSAMSRAGLPDYVLAFRIPGDNQLPISHPNGLTKYHGADDPGGEGVRRQHNIWRAYASPVWMDIRQTLTLNRKGARDDDDEKHICPLQLDVIERCMVLWSRAGDIVLTPFMGIGSEAVVALINGRKAIGIELKPSYYRQAKKNVAVALMTSQDEQSDLFTSVPSGEDDDESVE